jgi:hypothetical protein
MIIGTNWFLGFSHYSVANDAFIKDHMNRKRMADIMEVFVRAGVDTVTPREAEECIDLSLSILERRYSRTELQETRSKASVKG